MANFSQPHICQSLSRISLVRRDSTVTISIDRRKTGRQFVDEVLSLSDNLLEMGVRAGDVVAVAAYNRQSSSESRSAILTARPVVSVTDESCDRWYSDLDNSPVPSLRWHLSLGSSYPKWLIKLNVSFPNLLQRQSIRSITTNYAWPSNGAAIICFTSGTTGRPKGVTISHSALAIQSMAKIAICGYGLSTHCSFVPYRGSIMSNSNANDGSLPSSSLNSSRDWLSMSSTSTGSSSMDFQSILSFFRGKESLKGAESIRKVLNGGGCLSVKLTSEAIRLFPSNPDSRPPMMIGYWDQPLESGSSGASWFDTGDIGSIDESGNVWLIGRANGRIKSGGENVYPVEVEAVVLQHPGVTSAVVVGVHDASLGEMVIGCARISSDRSWSLSDKLLPS